MTRFLVRTGRIVAVLIVIFFLAIALAAARPAPGPAGGAPPAETGI